jgi:hypothetical protein
LTGRNAQGKNAQEQLEKYLNFSQTFSNLGYNIEDSSGTSYCVCRCSIRGFPAQAAGLAETTKEDWQCGGIRVPHKKILHKQRNTRAES